MTGTKVEDRAAARIDHYNIEYAVLQVERRAVRTQVFVFVPRAQDFNNRDWNYVQRLIAVRRLFTKDGKIRSLDRTFRIRETDEHVGEREARTARCIAL